MEISNKETKTFEITTMPRLMRRFERFLAMIHYNGKFGHSGLFGMFLDGDGSDDITIKGLPKNLNNEVDAIGGVGYDIEIACDNGYSGAFINMNRERKWYVKPSANLYKDGDIAKTVPSCDWNHPKHKI